MDAGQTPPFTRSRLWGNDKHRIEPMGPRRPDAPRPGLFMSEPVLEEKCEKASAEYGGQVRSPMPAPPNTMGMEGGHGRKDRAGHGPPGSQEGQVQPFPPPSKHLGSGATWHSDHSCPPPPGHQSCEPHQAHCSAVRPRIRGVDPRHGRQEPLALSLGSWPEADLACLPLPGLASTPRKGGLPQKGKRVTSQQEPEV